MFLADTNLLGTWKEFTPQFVSIILTFIIISIFCIVYNVKIRNYSDDKPLSGFLVITEMFITSMENLITSIMGKKYRKLTPYAMYIFLYIFISSLLSLVGVEPLASSYTVPLSMGFVTFIGIYYFGIRYQKLAYFKRFLNPVELITQFVPLISISFRLFGNIIAGSIILGMLYGILIGFQAKLFTGNLTNSNVDLGSDIWDTKNPETWDSQYKYWWSGFNVFAAILLPWLHLYFDLFDGGLQAIVFTMLTFSYWGEARGHKESIEQKKVKLKKDKKRLESIHSSISNKNIKNQEKAKEIA